MTNKTIRHKNWKKICKMIDNDSINYNYLIIQKGIS